MTPGKLGNTSELQDGYNIFEAYQIIPFQLEFVGILNKLFEVNNLSTLSINPIDVKFAKEATAGDKGTDEKTF